MKSKAATSHLKILEFIGANPNPTIVVSRRWLASPQTRQAFALICRQIGFSDATKAMDWIGAPAWRALKRDSSFIHRMRISRGATQQFMVRFCDELTEEATRWTTQDRKEADPFYFLRDQDRGELRSALAQSSPEKIALIGLFRTPEEMREEVFRLLSPTHRSRCVLALDSLARRRDSSLLSEARSFASDLLGRLSPWQLLMNGEPLPDCPPESLAQPESASTPDFKPQNSCANPREVRTVPARPWSLEIELADSDRKGVQLDLPKEPIVHSEAELDLTPCNIPDGRLIEQRILALYRREFPELHDELQVVLSYPSLPRIIGADHGPTRPH